MSKISGKETTPEVIVRKYLFSQGFRYRKNDKRYPGTPDIVLPKFNTVIFVHGCFWHGHNCKAGKLPETRKNFWLKKINDTKKRDIRNQKSLQLQGWHVIKIWSCELQTNNKKVKTFLRLTNQLNAMEIK